MTQSTQREKDTENGTNRHGGKRRARGWVVGAALVALGAAGGAFTTIAVDAVAHDGWHSGFRMHERGYAKSPERVIARVERVSAWALGSVDATDEQRERIDAILASAVSDLLPLRDEHLAHHRDLIAELARPQVDPAGAGACARRRARARGEGRRPVAGRDRRHRRGAGHGAAPAVGRTIRGARALTPASRFTTAFAAGPAGRRAGGSGGGSGHDPPAPIDHYPGHRATQPARRPGRAFRRPPASSRPVQGHFTPAGLQVG